jgi:hypothetical protein
MLLIHVIIPDVTLITLRDQHLKSLEVHAEGVEEEQDEEEQVDWKRYPFPYFSRLLHASTPLLLFDPT